MAMMAHHTTIMFVYAVNCSYDGNKLVSQEATTMSYLYCHIAREATTIILLMLRVQQQ
jgi:hypothetical protein